MVLAGHLDTVPIADNVPSDLRESTATAAVRLRHQRHEVRRRGDAAAGRPVRRPRRAARARPHLRLLRLRGGRGTRERARPGGPGAARAGCTATSRSCWSRPTARSRPAARARCGRGCDDHGTARAQRPQLAGVNAIHGLAGAARPRWPPTSRARSRSTAARTARGSTRSASTAASPATSSPTRRRSTVNFRFAPDRDEDAAEAHVREVFADAIADGARSPSPTTPAARCPGWPSRRPPRSSPPSAAGRGPSSAGPTSPGSPPSASRRSTTAPATRSSPTPARSTSWSTGCSRPRTRSSPTCPGAPHDHAAEPTQPSPTGRARPRPTRHRGPGRPARRRAERAGQGSTTDQRLLDRRGPQRLGAHRPVAGAAHPVASSSRASALLAELPRAVSVFGSARTPARPPALRGRRRDRRGAGRRPATR